VAIRKSSTPTSFPATIGKPKILNIFSSGGCSIDQAGPGGEVISPGPRSV
jgi:hypothetical protein